MAENPNAVYVKILVDTLERKKEALEFLSVITKEQEGLLEAESFSMEAFEGTLEKKEGLIQSLNQLEDGFEAFYKRLELILPKEKESHREELQRAQRLIGEITDLSVKLQAMEERNREKLTRVLMNQRQSIKSFKVSKKTAEKYYHNMANQHQEGQSYFLDKKK